MKVKEKLCKVEFEIFSYAVYIVLTDDIVKSRNNRSHLLGERFHEQGITVGLHSYNDDHADCYLFFTPDVSAGTIAHESFHAIHRMFEWIGAGIEEEVTAYYLGYLVDKVTKFIKPKK